MYTYQTFEVFACEVAGVLEGEGSEGWRLVTALPSGKYAAYEEERGRLVMLIFEKRID